MPLVHVHGKGWTGSLADNTPKRPVIPCNGQLTGEYNRSCTLAAHPREYPHLAGDGTQIVAMWWDNES